MQIHCFQHVSFETPGSISDWAYQHNHAFTSTHFFDPQFHLPALSEVDMLVIMGGPMNVDEEEKYPWLKQEKAFIKSAIDAGKKVIGICLGAQLIASALGEPVYKGSEKEIGFLPLRFSSVALNNKLFSHFTDNYPVFHWHGDTFDLPDDAWLVASTTGCRHQAFAVGNNVLALQFHPEMTADTVEQMLAHDSGELKEKGRYIQQIDEIRQCYDCLQQNRKDFFRLLDNFLKA